MSDLFDSYSEDFKSFKAAAEVALEKLRSSPDAGSRRPGSCTTALNGAIKDMEELVKQMKLEVRSSGEETAKVLRPKVAACEEALATLQREAKKAQQDADREDLMGGKSTADRQRALATDDRLAKQNERILQARMRVGEMETQGEEILGELARNRETIQGIQEKVAETKAATGQANKIVTRMSKWFNF